MRPPVRDADFASGRGSSRCKRGGRSFRPTNNAPGGGGASFRGGDGPRRSAILNMISGQPPAATRDWRPVGSPRPHADRRFRIVADVLSAAALVCQFVGSEALTRQGTESLQTCMGVFLSSVERTAAPVAQTIGLAASLEIACEALVCVAAGWFRR